MVRFVGFFWGGGGGWGLTQVSELTRPARVLQLLRPPQQLSNARIHSDKDACWRGLRKPRLATDDWVEYSSSRVSVQDWSQRVPSAGTWDVPSLHSLICSSQPLLLMFVLCYSLIENFWKCSQAPKYFVVHSTQQVGYGKVIYFIFFFPLSLKMFNFFVAWMKKILTQQIFTVCNHIYNRIG